MGLWKCSSRLSKAGPMLTLEISLDVARLIYTLYSNLSSFKLAKWADIFSSHPCQKEEDPRRHFRSTNTPRS
jgi:hypothetical protein